MKNLVLIGFLVFLFGSCAESQKSENNNEENIIRKAAVIKVKPDKLDLYKKLHAEPWENVNKKLKECNVQNYSIYYRGGYLFSYLEYTGDDWSEDMKKLASDSTIQTWWKLTDPCQEPVEFAKEDEWWANMEEVFHLN
jgi:L-rhamnose mutarotase